MSYKRKRAPSGGHDQNQGHNSRTSPNPAARSQDSTRPLILPEHERMTMRAVTFTRKSDYTTLVLNRMTPENRDDKMLAFLQTPVGIEMAKAVLLAYVAYCVDLDQPNLPQSKPQPEISSSSSSPPLAAEGDS